MFTDNIFQSIVGGFQTINGIELFFNKAQPNLKCNGAIHVALALSLYSAQQIIEHTDHRPKSPSSTGIPLVPIPCRSSDSIVFAFLHTVSILVEAIMSLRVSK